MTSRCTKHTRRTPQPHAGSGHPHTSQATPTANPCTAKYAPIPLTAPPRAPITKQTARQTTGVTTGHAGARCHKPRTPPRVGPGHQHPVLALAPLASTAPPSLGSIGFTFAIIGTILLALLAGSLLPCMRRLACNHALHFTGAVGCTFLLAGVLLAAIHIAGGGAP